jgi:glycosyltransferase involved in cell wall biosynthesis
MLSILIPVYNHNIIQLVFALHAQAKAAGIDFELIAMEDGSQCFVYENAKIAELDGAKHIVLTQNIGRSAIRNRLADSAKYDYLIFIDCDAAILRDDYIERYLIKCEKDVIISGGTAYDAAENNPAYSLRLKYGRERECFDKVIKTAKFYFTTFNFLIYKPLFQKIRFDETLKGYGCEDLIFGLQIKQLGYKLQIFDNQLIHTGLDENRVYLQKTENSIGNLFRVYSSGKFHALHSESRVLATFIKLKKIHSIAFVNFFFKISKSLIIRQITGEKPSLFLFDIFKLGMLCSVSVK